MQNIRESKESVDFWLDFKSSIESMLDFGTPEKHLEILELMFDAYIRSEFADMKAERREVHTGYGIFKDILKTLQKHSICTPYDFTVVSA
jgi:hypothetical protein